MALYELKEFLNFGDVAEYLTDKGVYDFDLSDERDWQKLKDFLFYFIRNNELPAIVYIDYPVIAYYQNLSDTVFYETCKPNSLYKGYVRIENDDSIEKIFYNGFIIGGIGTTRAEFTNENGEKVNIDIEVVQEFLLAPYKCIFSDNKTMAFFDKYKDLDRQHGFLSLDLLATKEHKITFDELLYPKAELDQLLLQQKRDNLQSQIDVLDNQLDNKELPPNSQKAVAKLLYALLQEHKYELGATKGATNEILENLTSKHGVKLSRETIAKWLNAVNDLKK